MKNFVLSMKVPQCLNNLLDIVATFKLGQKPSSSHQISESLIVTHLKQDVYILFIFEEVLEFDDVLMLHLFVNLDFRLHLSSLPMLLKGLFVNHLSCILLFVVCTYKLIAFGEAALSQKLSSIVNSLSYLEHVAIFTILLIIPLDQILLCDDLNLIFKKKLCILWRDFQWFLD